MARKIAVAVVHGVGKQKVDFAKALAADLKRKFAAAIGDPDGDEQLQIRGVYWARTLQDPEDVLDSMVDKEHLRWDAARHVMIDLGGDAIAYQASEGQEDGAYAKIHQTFAATLRELAATDTKDPNAPLCIISHSLGTAITSNYIWDLQHPERIPQSVKAKSNDTALERGETLAALYTMGSPIAVWGLRFADFGTPIEFPPKALTGPHPHADTEWVNIYDRDDVIAYPLRGLNDGYREAVSEDFPVTVGPWWSGWTPASHTGYWRDNGTINRITAGLVNLWKSSGGGP